MSPDVDVLVRSAAGALACAGGIAVMMRINRLRQKKWRGWPWAVLFLGLFVMCWVLSGFAAVSAVNIAIGAARHA